MSGRSVAVFGSSATAAGSAAWEEASAVGRVLAEADVAVLTGGYGGSMEAVSEGAAQAGGHVVGVTAPNLFPSREGANRHVAELVEAETLTERIGTMLARASGAIALPGSIGTAAELVLAWNLNHILRRSGSRVTPLAAVGSGWARLSELLESMGAEPADVRLFDEGPAAARWVAQEISGPGRAPAGAPG